jgi:uncharacterized protein
MLSLNLSRIRTAHERFERVYQPDQLAADEGYRVAAPVDLAFDIHKDKTEFHLVGAVRTTLELPCSRCLEPFLWPVNASFDLRYYPQSQNTGEGEREVRDDDFSTAYYQNDEIDLEQLMKEQFQLVLPMKPLCADDCKGLCPICGTNLNRDTCTCDRSWDDPRLAALKALKH